MKEAYYCFTVDDVAMEGYSSEEHMDTLLRFCAEEDVKATFFVVPRFNGRKLRPGGEYAGIFKQALESGHELAQHGLDHERFQFGIPPKMILDLPHEGPARKQLADHRDHIEAALGLEHLRSLLAEGRRILKDATGRPIEGFRAPCLSVCDNMFAALEAEGYAYDSSKCFQKAAWDLLNGVTDPPVCEITRKTFDSAQTPGPMRTFPLSAEYAWYLKRADFHAFLNLAKHDFDACLDTGIPFVPVCHVSPVQEGDEGAGFDLHRELLAHARTTTEQRGMRLRCTTLSELCQAWT